LAPVWWGKNASADTSGGTKITAGMVRWWLFGGVASNKTQQFAAAAVLTFKVIIEKSRGGRFLWNRN
jgi:hypothetical protein